MDLYEWAAGTWYADMATAGRALYTNLGVGSQEAERIASIVYGMEIRAKALLKTNDLASVPDRAPQDAVCAVLLGEQEYVEGPPLRPQAETQDHSHADPDSVTPTSDEEAALHSRRARAGPGETK